MKALVLGSGSAVPSLERSGPGVLVTCAGRRFLFDMGLGTLGRLLSLGLTFRDVDYLCFTHTHPDHTAELVSFLFACNYGGAPRSKPLYIVGSAGFIDFLRELRALYGHWLEARDYPLHILSLDEGGLERDGFVLSAAHVLHTPQSIAYRLETGGAVLVISGDSDYCPQLVELARGCDLLILECALPEGEKAPGHLTPALAGRLAAEAGCGRLVLTHFYPSCDPASAAQRCREVFSGEVTPGSDLLEISL